MREPSSEAVYRSGVDEKGTIGKPCEPTPGNHTDPPSVSAGCLEKPVCRRGLQAGPGGNPRWRASETSLLGPVFELAHEVLE